jgi:hypothetical protein
MACAAHSATAIQSCLTTALAVIAAVLSHSRASTCHFALQEVMSASETIQPASCSRGRQLCEDSNNARASSSSNVWSYTKNY